MHPPLVRNDSGRVVPGVAAVPIEACDRVRAEEETSRRLPIDNTCTPDPAWACRPSRRTQLRDREGGRSWREREIRYSSVRKL
jgi:hypothetical protein